MPRFEVVGIGRETGRKRVKIYEVANKETAIMAAAADGTIVDVNKITQLPDEPASERQIEYAKVYGIKVPQNATMRQVSEWLTKAEDQDWPTMEQLEKAKRLGLEIQVGITGEELDDLIDDYEYKNKDKKKQYSYKEAILNASCPSCKEVFSVPEEYIGKPILCPKCRHTFLASTKNIIEKIPEED